MREPPVLTCFAGNKLENRKNHVNTTWLENSLIFFEGELDLNSSFAQVRQIFAWENWYQESQRRMAPGWDQRRLLHLEWVKTAMFACKSGD